MATTMFPDENWVYKYNDKAETSEDTVVDGKPVIAFHKDESLRMEMTEFKPSDTIVTYTVFNDGISITDDNMIVLHVKATLPPSFFRKFELYIEDCNGVTATYSLDNNMVGKEQIVLTQALVHEEDFNFSYVTKMGFRFSNPEKARPFKFILSDYHTVYRIQPTYAQPEEVIEFLGLVDNKGKVFELSDTSVPSFNAIAKRICEAEEFLENACREAWIERRVVGEIRNADSALSTTFGYMGIFASQSINEGMQTFFKGIPIKLTRDKINKIDYSKGDRVEIRRYGTEWFEVPESALWADETKGIIYIKALFFQREASVRVTYRYGHGPIPSDIKEAVLIRTAMIIVGTDWYRQRFPTIDGSDPMKMETMNQWVWRIKDIIRNHTDLISCGSF